MPFSSPADGQPPTQNLIAPDDACNRQLVAAVHPLNWSPPQPQGKYDLVVIGAGTAGLVTAAGAAGLGAKVALIEKHLMGGDCLNVGCVPSKALLSAAHAAAAVRKAGDFGIRTQGPVEVDFAGIMQRMRRLRAEISPNDSAARFRGLGVDVFFGAARFEREGVISAGGLPLHYKRAAICTGARAAVPDIPGLKDGPLLTNESLFSLTELPARFAVIGGGPIGCEMAQCFARFGSQVTQYEAGSRILSRDDSEAAAVITQALQQDGVNLLTQSRITRVEWRGTTAVLHSEGAHGQRRDEFDALLVAVGRAPNIEGLNLKAVGVACDSRRGVHVDDRLRTANRRIYAAGDICFPYKFTHAADFLARIVIQNALFFGRSRASALTIPWCTYTSPELAHVGFSEAEAIERQIAVQTFTQPLAEVDRAILLGETAGFVKVLVRQGTDQIVGATAVAAHAGDLISEITVAMKNGIGLKGLGATIHPYPTQAEAIRKLGDQFNRTRLTPFVKRLLRFRLKWMS